MSKGDDMQRNIGTRKVEKKVTHDFGPTYRKIEKLADELVRKGTVCNRAQGVRKVIDDAPQLWVRFLQELV